MAALAVLAIVAGMAGCGDAEPAAELGRGTRLLLITMTDSAFSPDKFEVRVGESVTFRFVNTGLVRHEAVIGDLAYQDAHAQMMEDFSTAPVAGPPGQSRRAMRHPGMNDPNAVVVEPGQSAELTFSFARAGQIFIGCHETGHWDAGMQASITINP